MAVMDKDMGKLFNYRQLMKSPKYKKAWRVDYFPGSVIEYWSACTNKFWNTRNI